MITMQTSDPDIFAIGEIAEHRRQDARVLQRRPKSKPMSLANFIHGDLQSLYDGAVPMNILNFPDLDLCSMGIPEVPRE